MAIYPKWYFLLKIVARWQVELLKILRAEKVKEFVRPTDLPCVTNCSDFNYYSVLRQNILAMF